MSPELADAFARLPEFLGRHLQLTAAALTVGVGMSLPLGVLLTRRRAARAPILAVASSIQTIPSLALLAIMVPLLGRIGFLPAVIALTLYSILPVLRNTVTGIESVDPAIVEAGRGVGMTDRQLLLRVELPLALPVIIAGIRTATVWTVGIATLSTPVGATSLGNYIFSGLQTRNDTAVWFGCVAAIVLALALDGLIRAAERGVVARRPKATAAAIAGIVLIFAGGLVPLVGAGGAGGAPRLVVGTKTFTEQYLLARVIAAELEAAGRPATARESLGSTVLLDALAAGQVDCAVDYSGTLWANAMGRTDAAPRAAVIDGVCAWLEETLGVRCVGPLGFENAYALAMPRTRAESLGVRTIEDLAPHAGDMVLGGDYEFFARPEWADVRDGYGLDFRRTVSMDSSLMYGAAATGEVDVIAAFSTDGRIDAFDLLVLEDPRQVLPPYDALLLLGAAVAGDDALVAALQPLVGAIDDDLMRRANRKVDVDGAALAEAADWLRANALETAP